MAIFRKVHVSFWSDSFISGLEPEQRYFYLYLLTNEKTTQCGVYEITPKQISFDTGYSIDRVSKLLEYFIKMGKIRFNDKTNEIAIGKWLKYNGSDSPKVQSCITKEFSKVKDTVLIEYVNSMDTHPQEEEEQEEEKKKTKKEVFLKPTQSEVETYFIENGYTKESGTKAFTYYETGNWKDSQGKQVKNWKQKMQSVWFKPENKAVQNAFDWK